jgi:hypothetical protein
VVDKEHCRIVELKRTIVVADMQFGAAQSKIDLLVLNQWTFVVFNQTDRSFPD